MDWPWLVHAPQRTSNSHRRCELPQHPRLVRSRRLSYFRSLCSLDYPPHILIAPTVQCSAELCVADVSDCFANASDSNSLDYVYSPHQVAVRGSSALHQFRCVGSAYKESPPASVPGLALSPVLVPRLDCSSRSATTCLRRPRFPGWL